MPVGQQQKLAEGKERTEYEEPLVCASGVAELRALSRLGLDGHLEVCLKANHWDC
jgi:hypothetical protein